MAIKQPEGTGGAGKGHANADQMVEAVQHRLRTEVEEYRLGFGFQDLRELLDKRKQTPGETTPIDEQTAIGLATRVMNVTAAILKKFGETYSINTIQTIYQESIGSPNFTGHAVSDLSSWDLVDKISEISDKTLDSMLKAILPQADAQVRSSLTAEPPETADERVGRFIRDMTEKEKEGIPAILGSGIEDARCALGLRTLSALLQRYANLDAKGKEYALQRAFAWAQRGRELTLHTIDKLAETTDTSQQKQELNALGYALSMKLGKEKLGGAFEGRDPGDMEWMEQKGITLQQYQKLSKKLGEGIDTGTTEWEAIQRARGVIPKAWQALKDTLQARNT